MREAGHDCGHSAELWLFPLGMLSERHAQAEWQSPRFSEVFVSDDDFWSRVFSWPGSGHQRWEADLTRYGHRDGGPG